MENKKQFILIAIAVIVGLAATVITSSYITKTIQNQTQQLNDDYESRQKQVMATLQQQSEQKMQALNQEIQRVKTEQAQVTQKQIADLQARLEETKQRPAEPVKKLKPSLALKTPAGKRAVTIMIDSLAAVGGLLNPGDYVDVIAHLRVPESTEDKNGKNMVTAMIFQSLQVLAVNTNLEETGAYYDEQQRVPSLRITVAVDPQESGLLSFADMNGKLELALRSPQDTDHQMVKSSTWKTLADYVLQNQGADLSLPDDLKGQTKEDNNEDAPIEKPAIQIFRGGKEL